MITTLSTQEHASIIFSHPFAELSVTLGKTEYRTWDVSEGSIWEGGKHPVIVLPQVMSEDPSLLFNAPYKSTFI